METTAHTLSFFIYSLAKYPDIQMRCQEEVDKFVARTADEVTPGKVGTLPDYVEAVLKETMRKFPVLASGSIRQVKRLEGYLLSKDIHVPCGWWISVNFLNLHTYEGNWGPDAQEFRPERWLHADDQSGTSDTAPIDPLETSTNPVPIGLSSPAAFGGVGANSDELCFAPFSFGARNCMGMNLALMEMRVVILTLLSKFHFELLDKKIMDEECMLETLPTMRPKDGLPVIIRKRDSTAK
jgi:cytochrome P450